MPRPSVSIIVPALNEAAGIEAMLEPLQPLRAQGHEVILVDGGSTDDTAQRAAGLVDRVLASAAGRAVQMNAGAAVARGDVFWFLHADTLVDAAAVQALQQAMQEHTNRVWGRFDVRIAGRSPLLGLIGRMMNLRSRLTGIATGDQGIFVIRAAFFEVGGCPEQPLMEDIEFSRSLKRIAPPLCLAYRITTSGRRWETNGVIRTILLMWSLRLAYFLGARPERLALRYHRAN